MNKILLHKKEIIKMLKIKVINNNKKAKYIVEKYTGCKIAEELFPGAACILPGYGSKPFAFMNHFLWQNLSKEEREAIFLHEECHILYETTDEGRCDEYAEEHIGKDVFRNAIIHALEIEWKRWESKYSDITSKKEFMLGSCTNNYSRRFWLKAYVESLPED